jgi:molybdate-binding protein/transcriptional regulator with XRE-family HTH domain
MSTPANRPNGVRGCRLARGWSQQQLADRTGLSRAGVSAIEAGRLAPSVNAALALARALGMTVEELFAPAAGAAAGVEWAIQPVREPARYWKASVASRTLSYPVGDDSPQLDWHDGVFCGGEFHDAAPPAPERTLVVAGCDPAAGLLAAEYARQFQFRMLVLKRNSRDALELLAAGKVHAAGIHLGGGGGQSKNASIARLQLGRDCKLVRVARWDEGLAVGPRVKASKVESIVRSKARWVGREEGSGARRCQDEILAGRPAPRHIALDHRGVAAAIKCGWGDVGPCVRLASEESGLGFLKVSEKDYDICFARHAEADPRIVALLATLRSRNYRARLADLPGYSTKRTGELVS